MAKYPSQVGLFSAAELAKIQREMEERLSAGLGVASAREELLNGFLTMKPMNAARRRQVEIFVMMMTMNEDAGSIRIGHGSEHTTKLLRLMDEAEDLRQEFLALEPQE
ncbi:MAG: hypothetical protein V2A77_07705 [Pseudomonadota bacterium]